MRNAIMILSLSGAAVALTLALLPMAGAQPSRGPAKGSVSGGGGAAFTGGALTDSLQYASGTIAADDVTPDVSAADLFTTSANTGATAITDLDNPNVDQVVIICGGSDTNSSTIADAGNFALAEAFTASLDACISLRVQADNDYVEVSRGTAATQTGDYDLSDGKLFMDAAQSGTYISNNGTAGALRFFRADTQQLVITSTALFAPDVLFDSNIVVRSPGLVTSQNATQLNLNTDGVLLLTNDAGTSFSLLRLFDVDVRRGSGGSGIDIKNSGGSFINLEAAIIDGTALEISGTGSNSIRSAGGVRIGSDDTLNICNQTSGTSGSCTNFVSIARDSSTTIKIVKASGAAGDIGNIKVAQILVDGADPVLSACGTTPSVVGSDTAGKITIGTGVTTSCTATFAAAFAAAPSCIVIGDTTATTYAATSTTTVLTITSSADMDSDVINYHCIGL